ncbi:MFS transporter [Corynebacterium pilosum]|uniref:Major facilitator superfamily permease n=1 Tax=Corynebacterium pilosum TaxID=35756 RepID=A0A376CNZ5_9CORY|nr:MFS transporter [Corynebacterium pilosum]STC69819.1 major facilitator superfamily permease [Corynebacterium pilosum]
METPLKFPPRAWMRIGFAMFSLGFGANLFVPMLQVYREQHGSPESTLTAMMGVYAVGLIPALLFFGARSDSLGRRPILLPGLMISVVGSVILALGALGWSWPLFVGRIIIGVAVGMGMASGSAWIKELSAGNAAAGPRRATIAVSAGFGLGPAFSGLVAQFAPAPELTPYVVHIVLACLALILAWRVPETQTSGEGPHQVFPPIVGTRRFFWTIAAWAPWTFGVATTAFTATPSNVPVALSWPTAFLGLLAGTGMAAGVLIQPLATRVSAGGTRPLAVLGLSIAILGLIVSIAAALTASAWVMWLAAAVMGGSYGIMMVGGLIEAEKIAPPGQFGAVVGIFYSLAYVGFFIPFMISLAVSALSATTGLAGPHAYAWVLGAGILVCLVSIRPVARVSQHGA